MSRIWLNQEKISRESNAFHYFLEKGISFSTKKNNGIPLPFGRIGFRLIAKDLKRRKISRVWIPALICDVVPEAMQMEDVDVSYYPVTKIFRPDYGWLNNQKLTGAFIYVNYFGISETVSGAESWAKKKGLVTISDNAHGILSTGTGSFTSPDYSITSIGKILGLRYGSFLKTPEESGIFINSLVSGYNLRIEISTLISAFPDNIAGMVRPAQSGKFMLSSNEANKPERFPSAMLASLLWKIAPRKAISEERRKTFADWWRWIGGQAELKKIQPWKNYPLGSSDVPWIYPLIVSEKRKSYWIRFFSEMGIEVFSWPDFPLDVSKGKNYWRNFGGAILALPTWKKIRF